MVRIKELSGLDALHAIRPILSVRGWRIPHPDLMKAQVAFDGDEIIGFGVVQFIIHTEPLWVAPRHRGGRLTHELSAATTAIAERIAGRDFLCLSTSGAVDTLCRESGMRVKEGRIWIG